MSSKNALAAEIAERIVTLLGQASGHNVNIMGTDGTIIASTDRKRVGQVHDGARRIMGGEVDEIAISPADAATMSGVKPGYNGVVLHDAKRVACIGISGDPELVRPFQRMAAIVMREELDRQEAAEREQALLAKVKGEIADIAERMHVLSLNGAVIAARSGEAGRGFKIVVEEMRSLAGRIGEELGSLDGR